jgi:alpha-L-rhamnosidase
MGLLRREDWHALWIRPSWPEVDTASNPAPMLRRAFQLRGPVRSARVYVTSHGLYELQLNGRRVGDQLFRPGWTSYHHRLQYQTYDVTDLLRPGENALGATLGDGWYRGHIGFSGQRNVYGKQLGLLLQLRVVYADGGEQQVTSDSAWKAATGPILSSDIYNGEVYDARRERAGWANAGYDDRDWTRVAVDGAPADTLVAPAGPPVRRMLEVRPIAILHTPDGHVVFDMGQNMVGWVRLRVRGPAGTVVTLRHAEVLDRRGNLYTDNLRAAAAADRYTLRGGDEEVFEPHFTFHGFRYVQLDGFPGQPTPSMLTGIVAYSDMPATGEFETSDSLLNRLQHNIVWGQRGNFLDVPTDCPQRDERLGWTGDAQVFSRTAAFNMGVAGFLTKWLRDLAADQQPDGSVPFVIPNVLGPRAGGAAGWADAATVVPWNLYLVYGDRRLLAEQYPSMKAWVEYERRAAGAAHLWRGGAIFGDWLAFASTDPSYPGATTSKDLLATAYFARSTWILQHAARILGKDAEAVEYAALETAIRDAFRREFVTPAGRVGENTQTAYVVALQFGLVPDSLVPDAMRRLVTAVRERGNHLTTGFLGTPALERALSDHGQLDLAYTLLEQRTYPSWLYPVEHGATTIWERWDGIRPDSTFQDPGMNSFNHYAYGAIGDWMYGVVAGLEADPERPGYKHSLIAPHPGGGLTRARAALETQYGRLASAWTLADGRLTLDVTVPPNTSATVRLPGAARARVTESGQPLTAAAGVRSAHPDGDDLALELGSGEYSFAYDYPARAAIQSRIRARTVARSSSFSSSW